MSVYALSFYDIVLRNARCFSNQPAWLEADTGDRLSFGEVQAKVDRLAVGLRSLRHAIPPRPHP